MVKSIKLRDVDLEQQSVSIYTLHGFKKVVKILLVKRYPELVQVVTEDGLIHIREADIWSLVDEQDRT